MDPNFDRETPYFLCANPKMKATKYILLVAEANSPLKALAVDLKEFGFEVFYAEGPAAAETRMDKLSHLSAIVLDASSAPEADKALLVHVKDTHANLPIIWVGDERAAPPDDEAHKPDLLLQHPVDPVDFRTQVEQVLMLDVYPSQMVSCLRNAPNTILTQTFQLEVLEVETCLKYSETLHGNASTLLPFYGDQSMGHMFITGARDELIQLCEHIGYDEPDKYDAADIAGEIGNQVMGVAKRELADILGEVQIGLPLTMMGDQISTYHGKRGPTLSVRIRCDFGELWIDVNFVRLDVQPDTDMEDNFLDSGEISFL